MTENRTASNGTAMPGNDSAAFGGGTAATGGSRGAGAFARECFEESATRFMDLCREAVAQNARASFGREGYEVLLAAQRVAGIEAKAVAREEGKLAALAAR